MNAKREFLFSRSRDQRSWHVLLYKFAKNWIGLKGITISCENRSRIIGSGGNLSTDLQLFCIRIGSPSGLITNRAKTHFLRKRSSYRNQKGRKLPRSRQMLNGRFNFGRILLKVPMEAEHFLISTIVFRNLSFQSFDFKAQRIPLQLLDGKKDHSGDQEQRGDQIYEERSPHDFDIGQGFVIPEVGMPGRIGL